MKLRDLDGRFLRWYTVTSTEQDAEGKYVFRDEQGEAWGWSPRPVWDHFEPVEKFAEAHGVEFLCPKSFAKNGGPKGTHSVYVWFEGSPVPGHIGQNKQGQTVRWKASGSGLDDLVLTPSIQEQDEGSLDLCLWHGFVGSSGVPPGEAA